MGAILRERIMRPTVPNSKMNFLQKLHYTILKEIYFENFLINETDVPEPTTTQMVTNIKAMCRLRKLQNQEHRLRIRIAKLNGQI